MDDSIFARLGYDPARIHAFFHGPPARGGIARLGRPAAAIEVKGGAGPASDGSSALGGGRCAAAPPPAEDAGTEAPSPHPQPLPAGEGSAGDDPPQDGEGDHPQDGGGGYRQAPRPQANPLHHLSGGPPPRAGEDPDRIPIMRAWLNEHWETVEAMARAGEPPKRPAPPRPPDEAKPADLPVPYVARGDRWTKPKMAEFLRQLAATHSVTAAAKAVGMSRRSAYKLRSRLKGQPFDIAWEAAFRHGYDELAHAALELALEGEEVPHYYQGELKATHRKRNPQLLVQLLKMRNREGAPMLGRYNAAAEYWSEHWERMVDRVATGPVTWDAERETLGEAELNRLDLPDERKQIEEIIRRNLPDEPKGRSGG